MKLLLIISYYWLIFVDATSKSLSQQLDLLMIHSSLFSSLINVWFPHIWFFLIFKEHFEEWLRVLIINWYQWYFQDQLDNSEVGDLTSSSPFSSSVTTSLDSSFPTPTNNANSMTPTHTSNVIQRGSRRPSGKTTGPGLPHSVDSGIESPRSTPLYSPTTPITPKTSSR